MIDEFRSYEIDFFMLDLGFNMNILLKKYWDLMGKPNLVCSPIQLTLSYQYKIYPIGRIKKVKVNIEEVKTKAYFEVIEIMDDLDPYPNRLGI